MAVSRTIGVRAIALLSLAVMAGGCSGGLPSLPKINDLNPFAEKKTPLPGKRIPVNLGQDIGRTELATADRPIALPAPRANESWVQPGGTADNAPGHLTLGPSLRSVWSASAGRGSSDYGRLTAKPLVYGGRVYTLDAGGTVSAFSASGGSAAWRKSLVPQGERDREGYGGGLAIDNGRLYAATGFGNVVALDPQSGKQLWEKMLGVPVRTSPTAAGDKVFVVGFDGRFFALNGADGSEAWTFRGLPESASIVGNSSPAVNSDIVVVPYPSGELVALRVADGQPVWTETLARTRVASSLASMSDPGRPVIENGVVYAVGHSGRMVATNASTGERLWEVTVPSLQTPWVAGESVFIVDTNGQAMAIAKRDGKVQWSAKLQGGGAWSGPILGSGRLWFASSTGKLASVDAATGRVVSTQELGSPVYIAPVVASGRMYVLADNAKLIALN